MPESSLDVRAWCATDRDDERLSVCRAAPGVRLMSVVRSHRHWRETHATFTVAAVRAGQPPLSAEWRTRQRALSTGPGGLMAIEPGDVHVTQRLEATRGVADFDVIQLDPELVAHAAERLGAPREFHFQSPTSTCRRAFQAVEALVAAVARGDDALAVECATTEALSAIVSELGETPPSGARLDSERDFRLRRVKEYLDARAHQRPTLAELEVVSGLCQWRLCALFKRSYGVTLGQWWNARRLRQAVEELERGASIAVIVSELGYTDEPYFNRVFKAQFGIAPGAWRSTFRKNDRVRRRTRG